MILSGFNFVTALLDAIWPRFCVTCGSEGGLLCSTCAEVWWHEPPEAGDGHVAFFAYANPVVRKLICAWKYDYDQSAFVIIQEQARDYLPEFKEGIQKLGIQAIVPLALSEHRLRERGFNQSQLIAHWLSQELNLPVLDVLERTHRRGHQAERSIEQRQAAMMDGPFHLKIATPLPEAVLIVDDVWTTGATMTSAKKVLESHGKTKVFGFTLAKG